MIPFYFTGSILIMLIIWAVYVLIYSGIIRKMGAEPGFGLVPLAAEWRMSKVLFASMRSFYQPVLSSIVFLAASRYVGAQSIFSIIFWMAGLLVYSIFLMRLSWRISQAFNMGILFGILTIFFPVPCLLYLGYGRAQFTAPSFQIRQWPKIVQILLNGTVFLFSAAEFLALVFVVGLLSIRENTPRPVVEYLIKDNNEKIGNVTQQGDVVRRADMMDAAAIETAQSQRSRDYFYPDHSADKNVVVMEYVIATDLESKRGLASVNIEQIRKASKEGENMTVVLQVGAAERLYTDGMEDGSYARYAVQDGKIEKVRDLDPSLCMAEKESLADFIRWTKENYPADRYMLVFWDHGGGLTYGYGSEQLNKRADNDDAMPTSEIAKAIEEAGVQFDLIGFDTCLMQDFDLAYSLEPYADYFLASEESESGFGWNYTLGFSELAKNPGISTEDFGTSMVASFDPYNTASKDGETDTQSTLSLLDMTYVKPAHEKLDQLFAEEKRAIEESSDNYANISIAASGAYTFMGRTQIDLVDYLTRLQGLDYENNILTDTQYKELSDAIKACVVVRNANSGTGVNGVAFCFPVKDLSSYSPTYTQLDAMGLEAERAMCNDYFSIMASQQTKALSSNSFLSLIAVDYTKEPWYVKGFEDYDTAEAFIDIPLKDTGAGYQIELPDKAWKNIVDCQVAVYMHTQQGRMYLGSDHIGALDANGNPMVALENSWPHIGGALICYNADQARETEEGTVFSGTTRALLNGDTQIELQIECDPVKEGSDQPMEAHILGYQLVNDPLPFMEKGLLTLEAGDTLQFLFDYYDNEGKYVTTDTYGKKVRVLRENGLEVRDEPFGECDLEFGGRLTDIYQRTFLTEMLETHVEK